MIDPADVDFAKRCLETYYENCSQVLPGVPAEMRRGEWEQDGWTYWKLIPSRLTEADVHALESELTFHLPPLFRAFLISYFVLGLDFGEFQLPRLPCDEPLKEVRRYLLQPELWRIGYAQFGRNVEGDPVCFDLKAPAADGDYPVVCINHDWIVPYENWKYRDRVEPYAKRISNSFREFFAQLCTQDVAPSDSALGGGSK